MQSTNEELRTVNDELAERNAEATRLNDDLSNLLLSVNMPILIVGRDLRMRRFTPAAASVFGLLATDLGRPLGALKTVVTVAPALTRLTIEVLEHLRPLECTIQAASGHWYLLVVRPYVTLDGRIDGPWSRRATWTRRSGGPSGSPRPAGTPRRSWTRCARGSWCWTASCACGRPTRRSSAPSTWRRPRWTAGASTSWGARSSRAPRCRRCSRGWGRPTWSPTSASSTATDQPAAFLLNARHIEGTDLLLVAVEEITEAERAALAAEQAELSFRDALTSAAEGIVMVDVAGRILFANRAAVALFGYEAEELRSLTIEALLPGRFRQAHVALRATYTSTPSPRAMGRNRELVGLRKDGTEFPLEVVLSTMTHKEGPVTVAFVTDVTQRRAAEREIRAYQERLQRMAFDAALTEERERRRIAVELHDRIGQEIWRSRKSS